MSEQEEREHELIQRLQKNGYSSHAAAVVRTWESGRFMVRSVLVANISLVTPWGKLDRDIVVVAGCAVPTSGALRPSVAARDAMACEFRAEKGIINGAPAIRFLGRIPGFADWIEVERSEI